MKLHRLRQRLMLFGMASALWFSSGGSVIAEEAPAAAVSETVAEPVVLSAEPETEAPKAETEAPQPVTEAPQPATEAPKAETEAPQSVTEAPKTETEAPKSETEAPKAETEAPQPETEAPKTVTDTESLPAMETKPLNAPEDDPAAEDPSEDGDQGGETEEEDVDTSSEPVAPEGSAELDRKSVV